MGSESFFFSLEKWNGLMNYLIFLFWSVNANAILAYVKLSFKNSGGFDDPPKLLKLFQTKFFWKISIFINYYEMFEENKKIIDSRKPVEFFNIYYILCIISGNEKTSKNFFKKSN